MIHSGTHPCPNASPFEDHYARDPTRVNCPRCLEKLADHTAEVLVPKPNLRRPTNADFEEYVQDYLRWMGVEGGSWTVRPSDKPYRQAIVVFVSPNVMPSQEARTQACHDFNAQMPAGMRAQLVWKEGPT